MLGVQRPGSLGGSFQQRSEVVAEVARLLSCLKQSVSKHVTFSYISDMLEGNFSLGTGKVNASSRAM